MDEENVQKERFQTLLQDLAPDQLRRILGSIPGMIESSISKSLPPALNEGFKQLGYSEEIAGLVQPLAARSNDAKEDVLHKALILYGLALDAREKGNRLAILSPDDVIIHDIIGFEPVTAAR